MNGNQFSAISLQQLEAFVHVVQERSFSRAGERMRISQPSISKAIKNLEILTNTPLIERGAPGVSLTPAGRILFSYARRMLKLRDEARDQISAIRDAGVCHINIGASTIPATYILPTVFSALFKDNPRFMLHLHSAPSDEVLELLAAEHIEIAVIGKLIEDRRFTCVPLWRESLPLIVRKDSPLASQDSVDLAGLEGMPFIMREQGSATRLAMERHIPPGRLRIVAQVGSSEAVKEAIIAGLGVSILSPHACRRELRAGLLAAVPLKGMCIERQFALVTKRQFKPLEHHALCMEYVQRFQLDTLG